MSEKISLFWEKHPALLYGLFSLFGCYLGLYPTFLLFFPLGSFLAYAIICYRKNIFLQRLCWASILMAAMALYTVVFVSLPDLPLEGMAGLGRFRIAAIKKVKTHFGANWIYRGNLIYFVHGNNILRNVPISIRIPDKPNFKRPPACKDYLLEGTLHKSSAGGYFLKANKEAAWQPIQSSYCLAEWRWKAKDWAANRIKEGLSEERCSAFLSGIVTGDFDDRIMAYELGRFGLQHIMAISGFHFAILAAMLGGLLKLVLPEGWLAPALACILSCYFIFLGFGPSITRAWSAIFFGILGSLIQKRGSGLNSLGIGLLLVLAVDPYLAIHLGFQFSFLTTAAILLFFPRVDFYLQAALPRRVLSQMIKMHPLDQHAYLAITSLRQGTALSLAVNTAAAPLLFFYFGKFPLLSLVYNLFFPFLTSISMFLLICSSLAGIFSAWMSSMIFAVNNAFTSFMLNLAYNLPSAFDFSIAISWFSAPLLLLYLSCLFTIGILFINEKVD